MNKAGDWIRHGVEMRRPLLAHSELKDHQRITIVGGGLSGLCAAYRIADRFPDKQVILIEKSSRLGGVIETWQKGEWICDLAVNASRPHPSMWRLVEDLGLQEAWKASSDKAKSRWILMNGAKHKLSPFSLLKIGPFSLRKAIKNSRKGGSSVSQVIPHRAIADAMTLGIVNDTSENVDADFLFPGLTKFGNDVPMKKRKLSAKIDSTYPIFLPKKGSITSLDGGMGALVDALQKRLESMSNVEILLSTDVESPSSVAETFEVPLSSIIWTAPGLLEHQKTNWISIFAVGFHQNDVKDVPIGYGVLIPDDSIPFSGVLHESDVHHSKRTPAEHRLFRIMVPHGRWDMEDESIEQALSVYFGKAKPVIFENIGTRGIPQFKPGHMAHVAHLAYDFTYLGWSVSGVAITHVVDEAERLVELMEC